MDLFEEEQKVYDHAASHIKSVEAGEPYDFKEFKSLAKEYCAILKQLRRITRISDRTTGGLHESNLELVDKVHFDTLTGIHSRRFMEESLTEIVKTLALSDGVLSIMMIDIDYFKKYNDTYGHSAGDDCLRDVAKAIAGCAAGANGFAARYGGEEFVVVLPNTDEENVAELGRIILNSIRELHITHEKNEGIGQVTVSIGATTLHPKSAHHFESYIRQADVALYNSKRRGRNRYTYIDYEED